MRDLRNALPVCRAECLEELQAFYMIKAKRLLSLLGITLMLWVMLAGTAIAAIHTYPEASGHTMYRSLQTLREAPQEKGQTSEQAWQVVLFKRMNAGQMESMHLRLVGFPGSAIVKHPQPLYLMASQQTWKAPDVLAGSMSFPANVGEYDVLNVVTQLHSNAPLALQLETQDGVKKLVVPPFAVKEWRQVVSLQETH